MNKFLFTIVLLLGLTACVPEGTANAEKEQAYQTERLQAEAQKQIGMPAITKFTERKFAKMILELRDKALATYTYYVDMNGKRHLLCKSVGYGLPYSVQFTNPQKLTDADLGQSYGDIPMPQADPNGLYMPDGLSATWVLCSDSKGGVKPMYVEPEIIVSPFKL